MINRACERSVPEAGDRADIQRRYEAVLTLESRLTATGRKHLVAERSRWEQLSGAIARILNRPQESEA